jgi:hypothetical protein
LGLARSPHLQRARSCALYAVGALAAYWAIGRVAALLA